MVSCTDPMRQTWTDADYLSDRILDVVEAEHARMVRTRALDPVALVAGQLRALLASLETARPPRVPGAVLEVERAARTCLTQLLRERPTR